MRNKLLIVSILHIIFIYISCDSETYPGGKRIYEIYCENCHMSDGTGLPPMYPSLQKSSYLAANLKELPCLIKNGRKSQIAKNVAMPGIELNDIDMANLINYINHQWGSEKPISSKLIQQYGEDCNTK